MNKIAIIIKSKETEALRFNPTRAFYEKIGIKQKRFGQLYRKEISPTLDEITALAKYFNVNVSDLIG